MYQHLASFADVQIAIGRSDDARKMLPLLGFRPKQQRRSYRLITSAWKYHLRSERKDWKTPLRLGRDWARSRNIHVEGSSSGIEARSIDRFEEGSSIPLPNPRIAGSISARTTASLNHAMRCPIAGMEAYLLMRSLEMLGYSMLARVGATCRIAELWINSGSQRARAYVSAGMSQNTIYLVVIQYSDKTGEKFFRHCKWLRISSFY